MTTKNNHSLYSLILANLVVIVLAVVQDWNFSTIVWTYWLQSIIIGIFQFRKILDLKKFSTKNFTINGQSVKPTKNTKHFTAYFFLVHYGFFHFLYMIFLADGLENPYLPSVLLAAAVFFLNHLLSYYKNKAEDKKQIKNIGTVMFTPYLRIIPMHLIIVFGFFLVGGTTSLIIFLILKTIADAVMHSIEHKQS